MPARNAHARPAALHSLIRKGEPVQLASFSYFEFDGQPNRWTLNPLTLGKINLIVGTNSSGKSRTLNVIAGLAKLLKGKGQLFMSGDYSAGFSAESGGSVDTRYAIGFSARLVAHESLKIGRKTVLTRTADGSGSLLAEKEGKSIRFMVPPSQVVAVARRDALQHPYLDRLYEWGRAATHIRFGGIGNVLTITGATRDAGDWTETEGNVAVFRRATSEFPDVYKQRVMEDLAEVGYPCDDIGIASLPGTVLELKGLSEAPQMMFVKESSLECPTSEVSMSNGMQAALAVILNVNAVALASHFKTILIDDIGEGLDYERSKSLLGLLLRRAEESDLQLVMTTNDRFIMNAVPLEHWTVLRRQGHVVSGFNWQNSKKSFDRFKKLGLNNFDFFSGEYFLADPS